MLPQSYGGSWEVPNEKRPVGLWACGPVLLLNLVGVQDANAGQLFEELFGDDIITTCDSRWVGDCEENWAGNGADDSLEVCSIDEGGTTNWGMGVYGASLANGAGRTASLGSAVNRVTWTVDFQAVDGNGDLGIRLVFRDSTNAVVRTDQNVQSVSEGDKGQLPLDVTKPSTAVTVDAQIAAADSGFWVWIDKGLLETDAQNAMTADECEGCPEYF